MEPRTDDGSHGLATASVIMSYEPKNSGPSPLDEITGVAPRADIVPMRVAKVRPIIPTPVLLRSGMIRLRRAIDYGVKEAGCHVFSISLAGCGTEACTKRSSERLKITMQSWLPLRAITSDLLSGPRTIVRRFVLQPAIIAPANGVVPAAVVVLMLQRLARDVWKQTLRKR